MNTRIRCINVCGCSPSTSITCFFENESGTK
nr:MAG TPA: hypothetical protein [Crassvirales sp.]